MSVVLEKNGAARRAAMRLGLPVLSATASQGQPAGWAALVGRRSGGRAGEGMPLRTPDTKLRHRRQLDCSFVLAAWPPASRMRRLCSGTGRSACWQVFVIRCRVASGCRALHPCCEPDRAAPGLWQPCSRAKACIDRRSVQSRAARAARHRPAVWFAGLRLEAHCLSASLGCGFGGGTRFSSVLSRCRNSQGLRWRPCRTSPTLSAQERRRGAGRPCSARPWVQQEGGWRRCTRSGGALHSAARVLAG